MPAFSSVYFYHESRSTSVTTAPLYPLESVTSLYDYSLSFPINAQPYGVAYYNDAPPNNKALFIGPLTASSFRIGATNVAKAWQDGVPGGYVDLYYF